MNTPKRELANRRLKLNNNAHRVFDSNYIRIHFKCQLDKLAFDIDILIQFNY